MGRTQLATIAAGLAGLVLVLVLLPWFSVSKEDMEKRGTDYSKATQEWVQADMRERAKGKSGSELIEYMQNEFGDGGSWSGFSAGGLVPFLFALLGGGLCLLIVLGKQALIPVTERGILWLGVGLFGIATVANLVALFSAPTPKTFFAWISFLACAGAGGACFLATTKPMSASASAPAPSPAPDPAPAADADGDDDAGKA